MSPAGPSINGGFEGLSLKPVLDDPHATVNAAAFSWYPKNGYLGVAMRTDRWRFVEWTKPGEPVVHELYDQAADPQNDVNVSANPEYAELIQAMSRQLRDRFPAIN